MALYPLFTNLFNFEKMVDRNSIKFVLSINNLNLNLQILLLSEPQTHLPILFIFIIFKTCLYNTNLYSTNNILNFVSKYQSII